MFHNCKEPSSLPIKTCHHVLPTSASMLDSSQAVKHIIKQLTEEEEETAVHWNLPCWGKCPGAWDRLGWRYSETKPLQLAPPVHLTRSHKLAKQVTDLLLQYSKCAAQIAKAASLSHYDHLTLLPAMMDRLIGNQYTQVIAIVQEIPLWLDDCSKTKTHLQPTQNYPSGKHICGKTINKEVHFAANTKWKLSIWKHICSKQKTSCQYLRMPKTVEQHPDRWTTKTTFKRMDLDANFHIKALIILKPEPYITLGDKWAHNTIGLQKWKIETDLVSSLEHHNVVSCGYICVVPERCQCSYLLFQLWPCIKSKIVQQHQTT